MDQIWLWVGFNVFVLLLLAVDLGIFHRKAHAVSVKEAAGWSGVWVALALLFNYGVYHFMGRQAGMEFLTGYLIEKALSVDNIFIFVLIFAYFKVPHGDSAWNGKPAAIMGASIGAIATARAQYHLRQMMVFLNMFPINQPEVMIGNAAARFDEQGNLADATTRDFIRQLLQNLVDWTQRISQEPQGT